MHAHDVVVVVESEDLRARGNANAVGVAAQLVDDTFMAPSSGSTGAHGRTSRRAMKST